MITVDVHETDSGLADRLRELGIGDVANESMETGDVVIRFGGHSVGIEIKRESDYTNSLHSGRLSDQVYRLIREYSFPMLIVENWHPYVGDETTEVDVRKAMKKHIESIRTFNRRLATYETREMDDTLSVIESVVADLVAGRFNFIRRPIILEPSPDKQIVFLASLPNISATRAGELLELFGCPENAIGHVDEWDEVKGITKARVEIIKEVLRKEMER